MYQRLHISQLNLSIVFQIKLIYIFVQMKVQLLSFFKTHI
jgi:hypothetical protein